VEDVAHNRSVMTSQTYVVRSTMMYLAAVGTSTVVSSSEFIWFANIPCMSTYWFIVAAATISAVAAKAVASVVCSCSVVVLGFFVET